MSVQEQIDAWASLKGAALSAAKEALVKDLTPDALTRFLSEAPPAEIKKLLKLSFSSVPVGDVRVGLYDATFAASVIERPKLASVLAQLRERVTMTLDAPQLLEALARHPEATQLIEWVAGKGTLRELREAASIGTPSARVAEQLAKLEAAPEGLSVSTAEALVRLGASWKPAPSPTFPKVYRSGAGTYWTGVDPDGTLRPEGAGWLTASCAVFPNRSYPLKLWTWDTEPSTLRLGSGGEVIDVKVNGLRRILAPIGYVDEKQYYLSVDLADPSPLLQVFTVDHDGSGPNAYQGITTLAFAILGS